jgi:hypothetical protein
VLLINIVGGHIDGIEGIKPNAPLKAGACLVSNETKHLDLFDQVIHALVDMSESVDLLSSEMGSGSHQILILWSEGQLIGEGGGIDVGPKPGVFGDILHPLPVVVDNVLEVFQALDIILFSDDTVHGFLLLNK